MVAQLSHLSVGKSRHCPAMARSGRALTEVQTGVCDHLTQLATLMFRPLFQASGRGLIKAEALWNYVQDVQRADLEATVRPPPALCVREFKASRAGYLKTDLHFDPTPWLRVFPAAAYVEPSLLLREPLVPPSQTFATQQGAVAEVVAYTKQWDKFGKLQLEKASEIPGYDRHQLIPVAKDEHVDRIVHDKRPRNEQEHRLFGRSRSMPSGPDFAEVQLDLEGKYVCRVSADDLEDFYPSFDASAEMGRTNAVSMEIPASEFAGTRALRKRPDLLHEAVVPCNRGLLMGNQNAVDWAQESHECLLSSYGSYRSEWRILGKEPFPRSAHVEALVIDDHVALSVQKKSSPSVSSSVRRSFQSAEKAYSSVGLKASEKKKRRGQINGVVLGAELLGQLGWCGSERARRVALVQSTCAILQRCLVTGALMRRLVAMRTNCLLYCRALFSLLSHTYKSMPPMERDHEVY